MSTQIRPYRFALSGHAHRARLMPALPGLPHETTWPGFVGMARTPCPEAA